MSSTRQIYTVAELNNDVRLTLERGIGLIWLEAEISRLARPASGHWYFSLKDDRAQVSCAFFKQRNRLVNFNVEEGQKFWFEEKSAFTNLVAIISSLSTIWS